MKTKLSIVCGLLFIHNSLYAQSCYQAYDYQDKHKLLTTMMGETIPEVSQTSAVLHARKLIDKEKNYTLFWLEGDTSNKEAITLDSLHIPFLVSNHSDKSFLIKKVESVSLDRALLNRMLGIVDVLQFQNNDGTYRLLNRNGTVDSVHKLHGKIITQQYTKHYTDGAINPDIKYIESAINMTIDNQCVLWKQVDVKEKINIDIEIMQGSMIDDRTFSLKPSQKKLPKEHWFNQLTTDVRSWGFVKVDNAMSVKAAEAMFNKKQKQMINLLNDSKLFEQWVKENLEFLKHLDKLLLTQTLDDRVSKKLFANLGFIDISVATDILGSVTLNIDIDEKERFRSLMALKNTSAPMDDELLESVLEYGLSSENSGDFIKDATGMLIGTLAKNRNDRIPEQSELIGEAIISAISNQNNKTVALTAAGNMQHTAPDELVRAVDQTLLNAQDSKTRADSAYALSRIERSSIESEVFVDFLTNEKNSLTKTELIKASTSSESFSSNHNLTTVFQDIVTSRGQVSSTRTTALDALTKAGFGKSADDKKAIRKMLLGEKDADVAKKLRELYRQ